MPSGKIQYLWGISMVAVNCLYLSLEKLPINPVILEHLFSS